MDMQPKVVEIFSRDGERRIVGPYRPDVAERVAQGAVAGGAESATIADLHTDEPMDLALTPAASGQWPPRAFRPEEVASIYVASSDRYVVSFIAGYDPGASDVTSPQDAALAAAALIAAGCRCFVYDRQTDAMHTFEPRDLTGGEQ